MLIVEEQVLGYRSRVGELPILKCHVLPETIKNNVTALLTFYCKYLVTYTLFTTRYHLNVHSELSRPDDPGSNPKRYF